MAATKFRVGLRAKEARTLLQRLATDDAFRARVQRDPQGTLQAENVALPDSVFRGGTFTLPSKSEFQAMTSDLRLDPRLGIAPEVAFLAFFAFFKK